MADNNTSQQTGGSPESYNDSLAPMLVGTSGSLLLVAIILLVVRLWSRTRPVFNLRLEDWTVVGGTLLAIAKFSLVCVACARGYGRHASLVSPENILSSMRLMFICQVIWYWSITLAKLSVALLLLRLKTGRAWRIFLFATMGVLVLSAVVQTCFTFLQCRPFSSYWDPSVFARPGGVQCVAPKAIVGNIIAGSAVHVSTDLIFSFVPITFIRKLSRPRREKIFLCVLMGLGLFASSFAILRTVALQTFYSSTDIFRTGVMMTTWAMLEQETALIAATIPTLKSFMQRALVRLGRFFYHQETETKVWNHLVVMGYLGNEEGSEENRRKGSRLRDVEVPPSFGSPRVMRGQKDQFGDSILEGEDGRGRTDRPF